jgi:hypothetical protein
MMGAVNMEKASSTTRNVFPGLDGFRQLSKGIGINEGVDTNYVLGAEDETKILENNIEIKQIIENLEKRESDKNGKV